MIPYYDQINQNTAPEEMHALAQYLAANQGEVPVLNSGNPYQNGFLQAYYANRSSNPEFASSPNANWAQFQLNSLQNAQRDYGATPNAQSLATAQQFANSTAASTPSAEQKKNSPLGSLGTLAALAAAIYTGGTSLGAWGAAEGAAGGLGALNSFDTGAMSSILNGGTAAGAGAGGGMGFFDSILGDNPFGTSYQGDFGYPETYSDMGGNGVLAPSPTAGVNPGPWASTTGYPNYISQIMDGTIDYGQIGSQLGAAGFSGVPAGLGLSDISRITQIARALGVSPASLLGSGGAGGAAGGLAGLLGGSKGGGILDTLTNNPMQAAFNSLPFLLAAQQASSQRNDIQPQIDRLNALSDQFGGNQAGYLKSLTDPYDQATGVHRNELTSSLDARGVSGSSFGDQALNNFDYTSGLGRADLLSKGIAGGAQQGANITTQALNAINARNLSSNALLGAGLSASGQLFGPQQSDPFGIKSLFGAAQ